MLVLEGNRSGGPPGSSLAAGLGEPTSTYLISGKLAPTHLPSQLGNSEDLRPVEVVLVLERGMKGVRAGGAAS